MYQDIDYEKLNQVIEPNIKAYDNSINEGKLRV